MCLLNKAAMAVQVEKRDGLLIITAFLKENMGRLHNWSSISYFLSFRMHL